MGKRKKIVTGNSETFLSTEAVGDKDGSESGNDCPDANFRISIKPPKHFDTKQPTLWPRWLRTFEKYRTASGLNYCSEERQVSVLFQSFGEDAEDLLEIAHLSSEDRKSYSKVIEAFSQVFVGKRNMAKLHTRKQAIDEPFDLFLADLVKMVEQYNYRELKDELLKDRIVTGIADKELSRELQEDGNLTLETAILRCRQRESAAQQNKDLQKLEDNSVSVAPAEVKVKILQKKCSLRGINLVSYYSKSSFSYHSPFLPPDSLLLSQQLVFSR